MSENINKNTPACKLTEGGNIYTAGNAREFKTGDWRSYFYLKNANNVDYASLFAQMMLYQLIQTEKEQNLIMTIAKDAEYVQKYVHLEQ